MGKTLHPPSTYEIKHIHFYYRGGGDSDAKIKFLIRPDLICLVADYSNADEKLYCHNEKQKKKCGSSCPESGMIERARLSTTKKMP